MVKSVLTSKANHMKWHSTFLINQPSVLHLTGFTLLSEILAQWNERMWMRETWCVMLMLFAICCLLFSVVRQSVCFFSYFDFLSRYKTSLLRCVVDVILFIFSFHFICPLFCSYFIVSHTPFCVLSQLHSVLYRSVHTTIIIFVL